MSCYCVFSYLLIDENVDLSDHFVGVFSSLENAYDGIKNYCAFIEKNDEKTEILFDVLITSMNDSSFCNSDKKSYVYKNNKLINKDRKDNNKDNYKSVIEQCIEFCSKN